VKGLAELVMRGRWQALLVAVLGAASVLFCWISAAVVALVTLRRGLAEGSWLFFWTLLPAGTVAVVYSDTGPLALLSGTMLLAVVLRTTVNLPLALLASVAVGIVGGLLITVFGQAFLEQLVELFTRFVENWEAQLAASGQAVELHRPDATQIAGMLGMGTATMSVLCLLLARYWQAALYNPGGFGEEFRALRYPAGVSTALVLAGLALSTLGLGYRSWAMTCFIPLSFAGLALVHARVAIRGGGWLPWFYIAWVIFDPVKLVVMFLAIADSWLDFRQRWERRGGPPADGGDGPPGGGNG